MGLAKGLTKENEELKMKLLKVKHQRDDAVKELDAIKESNKVSELLRNYVTSRDIHVQTDPKIGYPLLDKNIRKTESGEHDTDPKKSVKELSSLLSNLTFLKKALAKCGCLKPFFSTKLLTLHSNLMKRYEKEVKQNMTHLETITSLNLGMVELEKKLKEKTEEITTLERDLKLLQIQLKSKNRLKSHGDSSRSPEDSGGEQNEVGKIKRENRQLKKDLDKLKDELSGLDHGFFEEIEDIKYALQQSAKLNKIYEKTLRKMCMQFEVPYPHPEKYLEKR